MLWTVEVTDTFAGEANYCWPRSYSLETPDDISDLALVRRAKRLAGWTGTRTSKADIGDMIELRPVGRYAAPVVMFITPAN